MRSLTRAFACLLPVAATTALAQPPRVDLPAVEVIGTAPVPGLDRPRDEIPANVQSVRGDALRGGGLPDQLGSRLLSVNVNEIQGNPFQADVNFRGFTASPLLGLPQGLSVFVDGMRANEPFGDIVNWDLIPRMAIDRLDLIPGSNPLFGLNTLGGALSVTTKNGFTARGPAGEASAGSFGRRAVELEHGGSAGGFGHYLGVAWFKEDGWRDFSPSEVKQFFGKLSGRGERYTADLSLTLADNDLIGNGLVPESMLEERRRTVFTQPDNTRNKYSALNFTGELRLAAESRLAATAYLRRTDTRTLNADANDEFEDGPNDGATGANGGLGLAEDTAVINRTRTDQRAEGLALQWIVGPDSRRLAVGASIDGGRADFSQSAEEGGFVAGRTAEGEGNVELENDLRGRWRTASVWASAVFKPQPALAVTLAGRFNRTDVELIDRLDPTPPNLSGDHRFTGFNPSLGATWKLAPALSVYGNLAQGSRAPSPIELGCADPANPCTLPNAMQADPPLNKVVTRSLEAGVRGRQGATQWQAAAYSAVNRDDILFVGTSTSAGYFTNFGRTRRSGAELGAEGALGALGWRIGYAYTRATYGSSACILAENNSSRGTDPACTSQGQDDEILVSDGDRIPGIPQHSLKLGLDWKATGALTLSADLAAYSSQYARGNENNRHQAGTFTDAFGEDRRFDGPGKVDGYAVLNLAARWQFAAGWSLFARINNVFDQRYESGAALAENPFDAAGTFQTNSEDWRRETFFAPGAPRAAWIGVSWRPGGRRD